MPATILVGMQWGDEGKGKITDVVAANFELVARFSGDAEAEHRVVVRDREWTFCQVPSAALRPDLDLVIADSVLVEPYALLDEIRRLETVHGFDSGRLSVGGNALVALPFHRRGEAGGEDEAVPAAAAARRDDAAGRGIRLRGYLDPACLIEMMRASGRSKEEVVEPDLYEEVRRALSGRLADSSLLLNDALDAGKRVLLEGAGGALQDLRHGSYPFVTPASTLAGAACAGSGIGPTRITEVVGVTKAYTTRLSPGPLPSAMTAEEAEKLRQRGCEAPGTAGSTPRIGWLDLVALRYAVRLNAPSWLALTKLDALDPFERIQVCVAYRRGGEICYEMPPDLATGGYRPVLQRLPGWNRPSSEARELDELPDAARAYLDFIEDAVGVPIRLVSNGPARHQICASVALPEAVD